MKSVMKQIYLERYNKKAEIGRSFYARRLLEWMIARKILPSKRTIKILDLGSGTGLIYFALKDLRYKNVTAIDRDKFFPHSIKGDIEKGLKVRDNQFDIIIARDVIEHMRNTDKFFKETYRMLKPNGKIILTTPATEHLHMGQFYDGYDHHTPFTRISLFEGLRLYNFRDISVSYHKNIPYLWRHTLRAFDFLFNRKRCCLLGWAYK